jgi:hypothetical protein
MSPVFSMNHTHEIETLASRYMDGLASPAEVERLESLASSDPQLFGHFVALLNLDSGLSGLAASWPLMPFVGDGPATGVVPASRVTSGNLRAGVIGGLGAAGLLLAIVGGVYGLVMPSRVDREPVTAVGAIANGSSKSFAVLNAAFDAVWSEPNIDLVLRGGLLPEGPLRLVAGEIEMLFASGGRVMIEGPAVFEPIADDALRLISGSVRCRCPRPGTELRVETPSGSVIDLGTEFAVSVADDDRMRVAVLEGHVQLDLATSSTLMREGEAVSVDPSGRVEPDAVFFEGLDRQTTLTRFDATLAAGNVNLLTDPSFESLPDGTEVDAGFEGKSAGRHRGEFHLGQWLGSRSYAESVAGPVASGSRSVRIAANSTPFWPVVFQEVPTGDIAGHLAMASVKVAQTASDPLTGRQCAIVKLVFVNHAGREFAKAERHFLREGSPVDRFVEAGIAAIAPPGTEAVRCQVLLNACGLPTGSIVADDAVLVVVDADATR